MTKPAGSSSLASRARAGRQEQLPPRLSTLERLRKYQRRKAAQRKHRPSPERGSEGNPAMRRNSQLRTPQETDRLDWHTPSASSDESVKTSSTVIGPAIPEPSLKQAPLPEVNGMRKALAGYSFVHVAENPSASVKTSTEAPEAPHSVASGSVGIAREVGDCSHAEAVDVPDTSRRDDQVGQGRRRTYDTRIPYRRCSLKDGHTARCRERSAPPGAVTIAMGSRRRTVYKKSPSRKSSLAGTKRKNEEAARDEVASLIESVISEVPSRTSSEKRALNKFTKELRTYLRKSRGFTPQAVLSAASSTTDVTARTVQALKPFHEEFRNAGLAVSSTEQAKRSRNSGKKSALQESTKPLDALKSSEIAGQIMEEVHEEAINNSKEDEKSFTSIVPDIRTADEAYDSECAESVATCKPQQKPGPDSPMIEEKALPQATDQVNSSNMATLSAQPPARLSSENGFNPEFKEKADATLGQRDQHDTHAGKLEESMIQPNLTEPRSRMVIPTESSFNSPWKTTRRTLAWLRRPDVSKGSVLKQKAPNTQPGFDFSRRRISERVEQIQSSETRDHKSKVAQSPEVARNAAPSPPRVTSSSSSHVIYFDTPFEPWKPLPMYELPAVAKEEVAETRPSTISEATAKMASRVQDSTTANTVRLGQEQSAARMQPNKVAAQQPQVPAHVNAVVAQLSSMFAGENPRSTASGRISSPPRTTRTSSTYKDVPAALRTESMRVSEIKPQSSHSMMNPQESKAAISISKPTSAPHRPPQSFPLPRQCDNGCPFASPKTAPPVPCPQPEAIPQTILKLKSVPTHKASPSESNQCQQHKPHEATVIDPSKEDFRAKAGSLRTTSNDSAYYEGASTELFPRIDDPAQTRLSSFTPIADPMKKISPSAGVAQAPSPGSQQSKSSTKARQSHHHQASKGRTTVPDISTMSSLSSSCKTFSNTTPSTTAFSSSPIRPRSGGTDVHSRSHRKLFQGLQVVSAAAHDPDINSLIAKVVEVDIRAFLEELGVFEELGLVALRGVARKRWVSGKARRDRGRGRHDGVQRNSKEGEGEEDK